VNIKTFTHKPIDISWKLEEVTHNGSRFYKTPDGIFPSVTTVVGWEKQKFFSEWRSKNPEESKRVTSRGTKFHKLLETYLNNENLDYENMHSMQKSLFSLIKPERVDCIAEYDGKLSIIDFKASTKEKREEDIDNYFAQATAYALMFQERTGIRIDNFAILIACEDGLRQVFSGQPLKYVRHLSNLIKRYKEAHDVPRTEDT
jgi:genome maintenance exonuclease 1